MGSPSPKYTPEFKQKAVVMAGPSRNDHELHALAAS